MRYPTSLSNSLETTPTVVVSACLLGAQCRYDGQSKGVPALLPLLQGFAVVPVCPELLAGMGVPRPAIEWRSHDGKFAVVSEDGVDVTPRLRRSCVQIVESLRPLQPICAVLKERSPSCGVHQTHLNGEVVAGQGMFTRRLEPHCSHLFSEEELELVREFLVARRPSSGVGSP